MTPDGLCVVDGCGNPFHGKGMCRSHYMKVWRGQMPDPGYVPPPEPTVSESFWSKVSIVGPDECWIWQASFFHGGRYGQFRHMLAHRFAYEDRVGPIAEGLHLDHLCHRTQCVNPSHLEAVPPSVNAQRGYGAQVAAARMKTYSRERTACKRGHALTPENTYVTPKEGWRQCRACKSERNRERKSDNAA